MNNESAPTASGSTNFFCRAVPEGGTEVRDLVTYVPSLGPLGAILNRLIIRPQLERIFDYRRENLPPVRFNRRLDPAVKTALPNVLPTPERKRLWNLKISKPSSI